MVKLSLTIRLMITSICLVFIFSQTTIAATHTQKKQSLRANLAANLQDEIAIIVTFNGMQARVSGAIGGSAYRAELSSRQSRLLTGLSKSVRKVKQFDVVSQMAMSVNADDLEQLLANPDISVAQDRLLKPSLAQSVVRVYPSQDSSPYHGNSQWAVAVLDTGIDKTHSFLSGKVVSEACYSTTNAADSATSLCPGGTASSTATNSALPCSLSDCGHGTQVAGVAVGNGTSFDGVARDAQLISIQIYSQINDETYCFPEVTCIGSFDSDLIAGLQRVYDLRNIYDIAAVNLSLGSSELFPGTCDDQPEQPIIALLTQANIAVIAASGNSGNTSQMQSPACISDTIAVAASFDTSDTVWADNNTSTALDLFAPGVNITTSTDGGGFTTVPTINGDGTSLAAPHVAGAWAVIRHAAPSMSVAAVKNLLQIKGPLLTQNAVSRRRLDLSGALETIDPDSQSSGVSFLPAVIMLLLD